MVFIVGHNSQQVRRLAWSVLLRATHCYDCVIPTSALLQTDLCEATPPVNPKPISDSSYAQYYASLVHQQNMLQDDVRTSAYHAAILSNAIDFVDKTVLDVGTGSGILAWFALKAGARTVYAVESSDVAYRARTLMHASGLADRIIVIKGKVEDLQLPGDGLVDVIISEPMGVMLIHERMLESYMIARARFLRPGGLCFPSTGTLHVAPFSDSGAYCKCAGL
jgi:type I protein arginine methyltransferase